MPFKHHPSESQFLSVLNGTAPEAERELVSAHVAVCSRCRSVSERQGLLLRELSAFSRLPFHATPGSSRAGSLSLLRRGVQNIAASKITWTTVAAAVFVLIFAWPRRITTVSAAELLSRAEAAQVNPAAARHFYRLSVASAICSTADSNWLQPVRPSDKPCERVRGKLLQTRWDEREMLSAHSYRQWHDGLLRRQDSVLHQEPYWTIKTDTDQGLLRSASLRVRSSDYRPVELTLVFAASEPVSIVDDQTFERRTYGPAKEPHNLAKNESLQHVDEPADVIEVQAWNLLRTLGADSGWETTITRKGTQVRVVGLVRDSARQDRFHETFSNLQGVTVDLDHSPPLAQRGGRGEGQPLAENMLVALIPDAHERGERVTQIADASRAVVGKAYLHDTLIARRRFFQDSPAAHALSPMIEAEQGDLLEATIRLSDLLVPVMEGTGNRGVGVPLTYSQARRLDGAVLSLVNAAPRESASLEETRGIVRTLLSR